MTGSNQQNPTKAAVLVPIFVTQNPQSALAPLWEIPGTGKSVPLNEHTNVLFTLRTHSVEHHKGQISFPGGVYEPSDRDLLATALRETHEEVGLAPDQVQVLGPLPKAITVTSAFEIHPFVGIIEANSVQLQINPYEIETSIFVPLPVLLDSASQKIETVEHEGRQYKLRSYFYREHRIWGATARILSSLLSHT